MSLNLGSTNMTYKQNYSFISPDGKQNKQCFLSSPGKTPCTILLSLGTLRQHNLKKKYYSQQVNKCSSILRFDADVNTAGWGQIS